MWNKYVEYLCFTHQKDTELYRIIYYDVLKGDLDGFIDEDDVDLDTLPDKVDADGFKLGADGLPVLDPEGKKLVGNLDVNGNPIEPKLKPRKYMFLSTSPFP